MEVCLLAGAVVRRARDLLEACKIFSEQHLDLGFSFLTFT